MSKANDLAEYTMSPEYTQIAILARLRRLGRVTTADVARAVGISDVHVTNMETGRRIAYPENIKAYSELIQSKIGFKGDSLYDRLVEVSEVYRITDKEAREDFIRFFYVFLRALYRRGE